MFVAKQNGSFLRRSFFRHACGALDFRMAKITLILIQTMFLAEKPVVFLQFRVANPAAIFITVMLSAPQATFFPE
jgi:hypothetical protein